ncbi:peptidase MA family metallohydrolase [Chloroflexota bacterium]
MRESTDPQFGQYIEFNVEFNPTLQITAAELVISIRGENSTSVFPLTLDGQNRAAFRYQTSEHGHIHAFKTIDYQYRLQLADNQTASSPPYELLYKDNRFNWYVEARSMFVIYWQEGNTVFAQKAFDTAQASITAINQYIDLQPLQPVHIIIYQHSADLRDALTLTGQSWVAGHADVDNQIAMVSIPPGPEHGLEMERQIPHEIAHIWLYQELGDDYARLPVWFSEGFASLAEFYPNPDYLQILQNAYETDTLLSMESLCDSFPQQTDQAMLAYAQAESFTRFLFNEYSAHGLTALKEAYASGQTCDRGIRAALGRSLTQLENNWRQATFNQNIATTAITSLVPWLILLLVVMVGPVLLLLLNQQTRRK